MKTYYWSAKNNNSYLDGCRSAKTLLGAVRASRAYVMSELYGDGIIHIYDALNSPEPIRIDERSIFTGREWQTRGTK